MRFDLATLSVGTSFPLLYLQDSTHYGLFQSISLKHDVPDPYGRPQIVVAHFGRSF